jgi:hypothetical protein
MMPENITLAVGIISAISGLVGVIVGGIITAVSNYLLYQKREKTERKRDRRKRVIEIKRASRLIDADLSWAQAAAKICVEKRHWWSAFSPPLSVEGWQQYRGIIAPELSNNAWVAVFVAVEAVHHLNTARDLSFKFADQNEARLTAMTKELLEEVGGMQTELTAISKGATAEQIESIQARLTAFRNNNEARITAIRVDLTEISDSDAEQIVPMLNDIKAGRLALAPFLTDVGKPPTSNEA